ncbi:alkaline phytoceramidase [Parasulfuritortus cantonensis]|uniref:Alkaline phytoceramidase n=1 Tax=Parasulfuritortus cantonensis TaxID=2528202 RepID=A0A4R1BMB1_9PROT|nr:alkaline phytoceramidase [Parasulfuritortus cantonensis]TCJ18573.1 alkaline phytoceramidase [Parasulfuritortus cantonensis]
MKRLIHRLPMLITATAVIGMAAYGPIAQLPDYHRFADQSSWLGIGHAADVLSNVGFAAVALWGGGVLYARRGHAAYAAGRHGWALFLVGLLLTAAGSTYYHLAPDDFRLVWDRLPIALACAGLLAAVRAETRPGGRSGAAAAGLGLFAVAAVAWWYFSGLHGVGDLRPYLLLQALPMFLIPLWQAGYGRERGERLRFGLALLCYVLAKLAELADHALLDLTGCLSGHTLKHILATLAAALLVAALVRRGPGAVRAARWTRRPGAAEVRRPVSGWPG